MLSIAFVRFVVLFGCIIGIIVCPPVTEKPPVEEDDKQPSTKEEDEMVDLLSYQKYLREVMTLLMSDSDFAQKILDVGNELSQKSGEIAKHLDFVSRGIRTRLDEVKRKELDRLRQMMRLRGHLQSSLKSVNPEIVLPSIDKDRLLAHLDHNNPNSFEVSDLAKLIQQATKDLEQIDVKRREEFKNYEMEKEVVRREELEKLDEAQRAEEEKKFQDMQQRHKDHPKVHHPGNEAQLQEVWEESDGLNKDDFDPRTFFHLHDSNGDGELDQGEIEALFQQELDKVYNASAPEDDMTERYEEMNRMREHVMNEVDKNKDKMISLEEFLESTKSEEFKKDEGWKSLDEQKVYSDEELEEFQRQYEELQRKEYAKEQRAKERLAEHDRERLDPKDNNQQVKMMQQQQQDDHQQQGDQVPVQSQQARPLPVQGHQPVQGQGQPAQGQQPVQVQGQQVQGHQQPAQGHQQPVQGHQQPVQGHQQQPVHLEQRQGLAAQPPVQGEQEPGNAQQKL